MASAEDALIAKLEWAKRAQSRRQIEDVAAILRVRWDRWEHLDWEKGIAQLGLKKEWEDAQCETV
jgi:hypothetical protein